MPDVATPSLDSIFIVSTLLVTVIGYCRGLGREILQLFLFILMGGISFLYFDHVLVLERVGDIIPMMKKLGWFVAAMYLLTFLISRFLSKKFIAPGPPPTGSKIAGALFALGKITLVFFSIHLAYAMANPYADRFRTMPENVQASHYLRIMDGLVEDIYRTLAKHDVVTYRKILERRKTNEEKEAERMQDKLGVKGPPKLW